VTRSDTIGLSVAAAGHVLLIAALALGLLAPRPVSPPPQDAIDVSLVDAVALESATRNRAPASAAAAPQEGPAEDVAPAPVQEERVAEPPPVPKPDPSPQPKPKPRAEPKPVPPKAVAAPAKPKADTGKGKAVAARGPNLDLKFLDGAPSGSQTATRGSPAPLGASEARALNQEISRQLQPYWRAPTGADADQLVTILRWRLNSNGSLASGPEVVNQTGLTESNRPQAELHKEAAIKAVRAAAPFNLPPEYYDYWKNIVSFRFDKRL
jgi:hypothetical protein